MWYGMDRKGKKEKKAENYTLRIIKTIFVTTQNRERRKIFFSIFFGRMLFFQRKESALHGCDNVHSLVFVVGLLDDGNYIH